MPGKLTYRDWLVQQSIDGFEASHPQFGQCGLGRADDRAVFAETLEDLAEAVDAWIDEHN